MITFNVTNEIFELYKNKQKDYEYRDKKTYWDIRLKKFMKPEFCIIRRGYTKDILKAEILDVKIILSSFIPEQFKFYIKTPYAYKILIRLVD